MTQSEGVLRLIDLIDLADLIRPQMAGNPRKIPTKDRAEIAENRDSRGGKSELFEFRESFSFGEKRDPTERERRTRGLMDGAHAA